MTIAVTMPGKMGDALYALPTARLLYGMYGEKIDFYTSDYCKPMQRLVEYQPYINKFIIPANYTVERMDMGIQPWLMPVEDNYSSVYHLGFRGVPDKALHQYMALHAGFDIPLAIRYEYPKIELPTKRRPYVCLAPRHPTSYNQLFYDLSLALRQRDIGVVQIGGKNEYVGVGYDATGRDMLDTLGLLAHSRGFVGLMSSQLVLANGFDIPRIAIHDGIHWDMRHVVYTARNFYPINPTVEHIIDLLDNNM